MRPNRFPRRFPFCALWGAFVLATPSFAARPLATDDAAAAESGRCQVEAWWEKAQEDGATVLAPACGPVRALGARWWLEPEVLGLDFSASRERGVGATLWTFGLGWYGWSL